MLGGALHTADTQHDIFTDFDAGLPQHLAGGDLHLPGAPFADTGQDLIVTTFQAHMNPAQPCLGQQTQLIQTFWPDILGRAIDGEPLQMREQTVAVAADFRQGRRRHGYGIAGGEKDGPHPVAVDLPGFCQICLNLGGGPDFKGHPVLVDHTKGAFVVGAAHRRLNQEAIGFTGRPVNGTFVAHL